MKQLFGGLLDLDHDGTLDVMEKFLGIAMLGMCSQEDELEQNEWDRDELMYMDEAERIALLEEFGLDPWDSDY